MRWTFNNFLSYNELFDNNLIRLASLGTFPKLGEGLYSLRRRAMRFYKQAKEKRTSGEVRFAYHWKGCGSYFASLRVWLSLGKGSFRYGS